MGMTTRFRPPWAKRRPAVSTSEFGVRWQKRVLRECWRRTTRFCPRSRWSSPVSFQQRWSELRNFETEHFSYLTSICGRRSKIASLYYGDFSNKTDFEQKTNFEQKTEHLCQLAQCLVLKHFWRFSRIVPRVSNRREGGGPWTDREKVRRTRDGSLYTCVTARQTDAGR